MSEFSLWSSFSLEQTSTAHDCVEGISYNSIHFSFVFQQLKSKNSFSQNEVPHFYFRHLCCPHGSFVINPRREKLHFELPWCRGTYVLQKRIWWKVLHFQESLLRRLLWPWWVFIQIKLFGISTFLFRLRAWQRWRLRRKTWSRLISESNFKKTISKRF